jgi:hypothetical protein
MPGKLPHGIGGTIEILDRQQVVGDGITNDNTVTLIGTAF